MLNETTPTPTPQPTPTPSPSPEPKPTPGLDQESFWKKAKETGEAAKAKEFELELTKRFGTANLDEIHGKLNGSPAKPLPQEALDKLKSLEAENLKLKSDIAEGSLNNKIKAEIAGAVKNPELVLREIRSLYDVKQEGDQLLVYEKGSDKPKFHKEKSSFMTIKDLMEDWQKQEAYDGLFRSGPQAGTQGHVMQRGNPGGLSTAKMKIPDKMELVNPLFIRAIEATNQIDALYAGQAINYDVLEPYLKGARR